ncbi:MAG: flagellar basal body L-ring protein FlgH [Pyrinomonadaceae bacterium]
MKIKLIATALLLACALTSGVFAQNKKEKKKRDKNRPKLTVVKIEDAPPTIPVPEPQKPANGSLFSTDGMNANLLVDFKARRIGDLVFVDIVETSEAEVSSGADRSRDSGDAAGIGTLAGALPISGAAAAQTVIGALGTRSYSGSGSTQRNSQVRARITARVVEVLPNGDLKIEALKLVRINKETEQVAVTGIVRQNDLGADNSITTVEIGDLRVEFNGKGVASKDNAPGWLFRLFDKISPF